MSGAFVLLGDPAADLEGTAGVLRGGGFDAGINDWDHGEALVFAVSLSVGITPSFAQALDTGLGRVVRPAAIWFYDQDSALDPELLELSELESRGVLSAAIGEELAESLPGVGTHQADWDERLGAALEAARETRELVGLDKAILKQKRVKALVKEPKKGKKKPWWKLW